MELFDSSETASFSPYKEFVRRHAIDVTPVNHGSWEFSGEHETLQTKVESKFMARAEDGTEATAKSEKAAVFDLGIKLGLKGMDEVNWDFTPEENAWH